MSMSKEEQLRQAAIGDDDSDDENEGLTRRRGGGGGGGGDGGSTTPTMESTEMAARESARRFLWDEDELEDVTPIPGSVVEASKATTKGNSSFKGGFRFPLSPPGGRTGGFHVSGSEGMAGMEFKFHDAFLSGEAEEHITHKSRYHRTNPIVAGCLGCYHIIIGTLALFLEFLCSPKCRRVLLALLGLTLAAVGVQQIGKGISKSAPIGKSSTKRLELVREKVIELELSDVEDLDAVETPQYNALYWISDVDKAQLDIDDEGFLPRYVLAVLFFSTSGAEMQGDGSAPSPMWNDAENWMSSKTLCEWHGVECVSNEGHGSILSLNLTENLLQGPMPTELEALPDLQVLDLSKNELEGPIPTGILKMPSLVDLNLRANKLTGPVPHPSTTTSMSLRQVHLGENKLTGSIPQELSTAVQLRALALDMNELTGSFPDLSPLENLSVLYLDRNSISGSLPTSLFELRNLIELRLEKNKFTGAISSKLSNLEDLEILRVQENSFTGDIPDVFGTVTKLTELNLAWNSFAGPVHESFGNLKNLESLLLDQNKLTGALPTTLGRMKALTRIYMTQNSLVGALPTELGRLTNLEDLRVQGNGFTGSLPSELGQCTELREFYAEYNFFEGEVPTELGSLTSLEILKLTKNGFTGTMPESVCDLIANDALTHVKVDCARVECDCCENCNKQI